MTVKKDLFAQYISEQEALNNLRSKKQTSAQKQYSSNRVFDEPISLKESIHRQSEEISSKKHKRFTNSSQTNQKPYSSKSGHKSENTTNGSQTVHKRSTQPITNGSQTVHRVLSLKETVHKRSTQPITNGSQTVHKSADFSSLPDTQKKLLKALFLNCQINGSRTTKKLTLSYISEMANIKKTSLKNTIWRLKNKGFLITKEYKDGRGGWVVYEIPKEVFFEIITLENGSQTVHKRFTQPITERYTNNSSILNTTIKEKGVSNFLPEEWQRIDISPLKEEGFSKKHLIELYKVGEISPEIVQHSINHFAWGVKNNPDYYEKYQNKIFVLMGKLRKGGVWTESNYESPQEIALKELLEEKKRQQAKQEKLISDLMELEFPEWEKGLTLQQKKEINPYHSTFDRIASSVALKHYFKKEILMPRLREEGVIKQGNYKKTKV